MDFNALKYFYYVVKEGSFSKAADELYVSQSAISQQVKKLELHFKQRIFEKTLPKIKLSKFGKELFQISENFYSSSKMFQYEDSRFFGEHDRVVIGFSQIIGSYYVYELLKSLLTRFPKIKVDIVIDSYSNLVSKLLQRELLFFISGNYVINDSSIKGETIEEVKFGFVSSSKIKNRKELKNLYYIKNRADTLGETYQFVKRIERKGDIISDVSSELTKQVILQGKAFKYIPLNMFREEIEMGMMNFFPALKSEMEQTLFSQIVYREESIGDKKLNFFIRYFKNSNVEE